MPGAAVAAGVGAVGTIFGGLSAKQQADAEAEILQQQAARARQIGIINAEEFEREGSAIAASGRAAGAGSGVVQSTGSALKRQENLAAEIELNRLRLLNNSQVQSTRLFQQAELVRARGKAELIGSFFRAGSSFIGGAGGGSTKKGLIIDQNIISQSSQVTFGLKNSSGRFFS